VIVLDEPTSSLDVSVQAQVIDLFRQLQHQRNLAYLFISHDLKVVRALANNVIVLRNGKVVEHGPADVVLRKPAEDYTKALIAAALQLETAPEGVVRE
jgi:microcin C transport system ATP-binding protein